MGEAKRRKAILGEDYGKQENTILPGIPITKKQSKQFMTWTTRGSWIGIGALVTTWVVIRFLGPALGWWEIN
ncbi:MAG: DUF2839 domain-containing protein [Cyanobacteria bacterium P01_D01_bin.73]